jgi:hypothetical protein
LCFDPLRAFKIACEQAGSARKRFSAEGVGCTHYRLHLSAEQHAGELIAKSKPAGLLAKAGHEKIGSDRQPNSEAPTLA